MLEELLDPSRDNLRMHVTKLSRNRSSGLCIAVDPPDRFQHISLYPTSTYDVHTQQFSQVSAIHE